MLGTLARWLIHFENNRTVSNLFILGSLKPEVMFTLSSVRYGMNSNGTDWKVVHVHLTSCRSGWPRGFGELNPRSHSSIFTSVSVDSSPHSHLFTSMVQIQVQTAPKCCTEPLRYMTLHFRDRRGAALLRYRNRAKITVLMCEQKPYIRYGFRAGARAIPFGLV